jgi:hypothetical protein
MSGSHPIRCRCGAFEARVDHPRSGTRAVCYCRDCQAYAHFLELPERMLDENGGTDIVAVRPRFVTIVRGKEKLACMSLSASGILRWHTRCCGTPIGNTPRDLKQSHVGLVHTCLESAVDRATHVSDSAHQGSGAANQLLDEAFGPVAMRVFRRHAKGRVDGESRARFVVAVAGYLASMTWTRVSGRYRVNPFFDPVTHAPISAPRVLTEDERTNVYAAVDGT